MKHHRYNGCIVRVASSFVFKEPVFNCSNDFPLLRDEITVPGKVAMASMTVHRVAWPRLDVRLTGEVSPTPPTSHG